MQTSQTTRRAVVTGALAASTAVAATSTAIAKPPTGASPDAELLALGRRFDEQMVRHQIASVRWEPNFEALSREFDKLAETKPHADEVWRATIARVDAEYPINHESPDRVMDESSGTQRAIMALPATTIAGLAVKARVARLGCSHYWREPWEDADWDHKVVRQLVEAIEAMALAGRGEV